MMQALAAWTLADAWQMRPATQEADCVLGAWESIFFWISISVAMVSHLVPSLGSRFVLQLT